MKMKKTLLTSAVALALLGGCNNDYDGQDIAGSKLVVSASIDQVNTRVSDTGIEWTIDDAIGVSDNLSNPNLNIKYVAGSTAGSFASTTGIYILGNDEVTYTAYYPYAGNEGVSADVQNFKITDAEGKYVGHAAIDFMYAKGTASRSNPNVNFRFKHMMSKLSLDITDSGAAATKAETPISYTLKNVIVDGTFNTETGEVKSGSTKGNVTVDATLGAASSIILPPVATSADGEAEVIELLIKVGDKAYSGSLNPALSGSQEYQYSIDLSQTTEGTALKIDSPTIEGWTPNNNGNLVVKEEINYNPTLEVGDFFCTDGTTIDKDYDLTTLDEAVKGNIVGVVFHLGDITSDDPILAKDYPLCTHGLVVALNNANTEGMAFGSKTSGGIYTWLTNKKEVDAETYSNYLSTQDGSKGTLSVSTVMQGYNNTKQFILASQDDTTIPTKTDTWPTLCSDVITQLASYKSSASVSDAGSSDWYLPSWYELYTLGQNKTSVQTSITKAGGTLSAFDSFTKDSSDGLFYWSSTERAATLIWVSSLCESEATTETMQAARASGKGWYRFVLAF